MREVKFQIIEEDKMIGEEIFCEKYNGGTWYHILYAEGDDPFCHCGVYMPKKLIQSSRRQYIGLKDKNGKEIYEGDIILNPDRNGNNPHRIKFSMGKFVGEYGLEYDLYAELDRIEIIGNIYENPELLNK